MRSDIYCDIFSCDCSPSKLTESTVLGTLNAVKGGVAMGVLTSGPVPFLSILFLALSVLVMVLLPIGAAILLKIKLRFSAQTLLAGMLAFVVSQILIRIPLLNFLQQQFWFIAFATANPALYGISLAFTAALFEGVGRFFFLWLLVKKDRTWAQGIGNGIGHGGVESLILGISGTLPALFYAIILNGGNGEALLLLNPQLEAIFLQLQTSAPAYFLLPGLERIFTICLHTAVSVLFLLGFARRKWHWFAFGVLLHTVADTSVLLPGLWAEVAIGAIAVFSVWLIFFLRGKFPLLASDMAAPTPLPTTNDGDSNANPSTGGTE